MPPRTSKRQESVVADEKGICKSRFFSEENTARSKESAPCAWQKTRIPPCIKIASIRDRLRASSQPPSVQAATSTITDQEEETGSEFFKQTMLESQKIETVRKQSFFSEELTEEERDIVAKRVALQQRQFAEYERREKIRKSKAIQAMFEHVNNEEIQAMLLDCDDNEDEVIYRLTQPSYLYEIRKQIALKYSQEEAEIGPGLSAAQEAAYQQLLKKRSRTLKRTTNDNAKKQYRMGGRLGLDEALQQVQKHRQADPEKAFEGWSQARIRAYQMINENPNSYYYRFNAPGEVQRRGQWTEEEQKLFFERLEEVGANGQWGIFSMKIPGRVGYQCSNFYRLLVETKKIKDPNYVLDERGKAHYLFDKKNANGETTKTFRTHNKNPFAAESSSSAAASTSVSRRKQQQQQQQPKQQKKRVRRNPTPVTDDDEPEYSRQVNREPSPVIDIDDDSSSGGVRRSKRKRRPTAAAIEAGLVPEDKPYCSWDASLVASSSSSRRRRANKSSEESSSCPSSSKD